jgi:hypothetical protein
MKAEALLYGLNYANFPRERLFSPRNDALRMQGFLDENGFDKTTLYSDNSRDCGDLKILQEFNNLAISSWRNSLDLAWIYFSGHGVIEKSEHCLVCSDYNKTPFLPVKYLEESLKNFNPDTRVVCVFDCCHFPLLFSDKTNTPEVIVLSASEPDKITRSVQVSTKDFLFTGVLTESLLFYLRSVSLSDVRVLDLLSEVKAKVKKMISRQSPQLSSNFEITYKTKLI